jgi:predicted metal-dependent peptidase
MKFAKVIGKIDSKLLVRAEEALSQIFLELGTRYSNTHVGSFLGGDPLIFGLMYPVEHIATLNIPTAATDGKRYYWNPKFLIKLSKIGLRIICAHEAWHAIYMHPSRRGSRIPKLWNIAVDYIVNGTAMEDLRARKRNPEKDFTENVGRFMKLKDYAELIKNPKAVIKGFEDLKISEDLSDDSSVELPKANEDRELTPQEQKELERREKKVKFYYADPELDEEMKRPEKIYDFLYNLLPKCSKCGSVGKYPSKSKKSKKPDDKKESGDQSNDPQDQSKGKGKGCDQCGDGLDIFGLGGTLDDHMDTEESEEKLAKRISDAMESAKKMAGYVPGALEEELGKLTAPKVTWQDIVRTRLLKARAGNGRNDWTRFRTRPMFTGLLVPKRKNYFAHFGCLLDTSGSMGKDDMAFGLSQLQSLDERSEGTIVPADAQIYWEDATKLKKCDKEEISKVKVMGRGGTKYAEFFDDYEKHIGKCDFLIIITDGFLLDTDIAEMKNPGVDVIWLLTSSSSFNAPFGRVFDLHST